MGSGEGRREDVFGNRVYTLRVGSGGESLFVRRITGASLGFAVCSAVDTSNKTERNTYKNIKEKTQSMPLSYINKKELNKC